MATWKRKPAGEGARTTAALLYAGVLVLFFLQSLCCCAPQSYLQARPEDLAWWREARFGLFIHWGPVSLMGTEIGWSRGGERRGRRGRGPIPVEVYDNLYKRFNPTAFSAPQWVDIARKSGMRYLVFTTKHHDGFCMFDSQLTEYKITNSPYGKDITAELAGACHRASFPLGFYYSPPDWHHPDYRTEHHGRYIRYLHGQIKELCTKYGHLSILWFDGLGGKPGDWQAHQLVKMVRALQKGILINNRAGLPCDFDTPEQRIGRFQRDRAWETCMTLGTQWAWKPKDRLKSVAQCIHILVRCAGGDGNLLLNVGPMPSGRIEPRQVKILHGIGAWLKRFGKTVYGTRGGPFMPGRWGASTLRGNTVYLHILEGSLLEGPFHLPPLQARITAARLFDGTPVPWRQERTQIVLTVPKEKRHSVDTICALTLDRPAEGVPPVAVK